MVIFKELIEKSDFSTPVFFEKSLLADKRLQYSYNFPLSFSSPLLQFNRGGSKKKVGVFLNSYSFYTWLNNYVTSITSGYRVEFVLNSTSYKADKLSVRKSRVLNLDLGFSHTVNLILPNNVYVLIEKRKLMIFSYDYWWITNFSNFFQNLRYPNAYTSKGILLKGQVITLKPGKRRQ